MAAANNEFFEALSMLEHERGITAEYLIEKIKAAIVIAVKKNYEVEDDNVLVEIDPDSGKFNVALVQNVVADEDWYDEHAEIGITEAQKIRKSYEVGDRVVTPLKTKDFGRIAAQTAKHVIRQGIREAERSQQLSEIQSRAHDIVQATVTRVDPEKGIVALDLGKGGEAILPRNEQVPGEVYTEGQSLQVYVVDVVSTERGPRVMISRTTPALSSACLSWKCPRSLTAPWRSRPSAARPVPAPRWLSGARMPTSTPFLPASAPMATVWPLWSRSWAVRRSISSSGARMSPSSSPQP